MKQRHIEKENWSGMALIFILASLIFVPILHAKTVQVGIVYDGDSAQFEAEKKIFINEIQSMSRGAHTVNFPANAELSGGWDVKKINQALDHLIGSKKVDMILALGEVSTHEACKRRNFKKPVFAIGGKVENEASDIFDGVYSLVNGPLSLDYAMENSEKLLYNFSFEFAKTIKILGKL